MPIESQGAVPNLDAIYRAVVNLQATSPTAAQAAALQALVSGACISGEWRFALSLFRLRITGTGTVTMDSRDSLGNITLNSSGPYTATAATDQIEFPYAGDDAREIRLTFPATATVEVI